MPFELERSSICTRVVFSYSMLQILYCTAVILSHLLTEIVVSNIYLITTLVNIDLFCLRQIYMYKYIYWKQLVAQEMCLKIKSF